MFSAFANLRRAAGAIVSEGQIPESEVSRGSADKERLFPGRSEHAGLMKRFDRAGTPIEPPELWPPNNWVVLPVIASSKATKRFRGLLRGPCHRTALGAEPLPHLCSRLSKPEEDVSAPSCRRNFGILCPALGSRKSR